MSAMPPEWSARSLLARFAVYGHFYERKAGGALWQLRDRLEIFEHALPWERVRDGNADMVAVMMNPGASRPLAEADADGWCPALPDRTQYQLMRLTLVFLVVVGGVHPGDCLGVVHLADGVVKKFVLAEMITSRTNITIPHGKFRELFMRQCPAINITILNELFITNHNRVQDSSMLIYL